MIDPTNVLSTRAGRILTLVIIIAIAGSIAIAVRSPRMDTVEPDWSFQKLELVFKNIRSKSGVAPILTDWRGGKAILMTEEGWNKMSQSDRDVILAYAKESGLKAILVGAPTGSSGITIDRAVWGE
jgi:hypothetical protein